jgi:hypothetical protein
VTVCTEATYIDFRQPAGFCLQLTLPSDQLMTLQHLYQSYLLVGSIDIYGLCNIYE